MKKSILFLFSLCLSIILHAQVYKTVNVVYPIGLYSTLSTTELNTVTNLTITGTIDATDFVALRDNMPVLSVLDLSGATIEAYKGKGGTSQSPSTSDTIYSANTIPQFAFCDSLFNGKKSLTNIILPQNLVSINIGAFWNCTGLTSIVFPPSVTNIGASAFRLTNLNSVTISSTVTSIGYLAFTGNCAINVDVNNVNYSSIDGVLFDKKQTILYQCPSSKTGDYIIPSTVTEVQDYAFFKCKDLTSITIPASVNLFETYFSLTNVKAQLIIDTKNPNYSSIGGILFNKNQTTLLHFPTQITGNYVIPSSVTTIKANAFGNTFGGTDINSITIPETVISIGSGAFKNCQSLKSFSLPASKPSLDLNILEGCSSLQSLYNYSVTPQDLNDNPYIFKGIDTNNCVLFVPFQTSNLYQTSNQWKSFKHINEMLGISLSKTNVTVADTTGSNVLISIFSNSTYKATSNQNWLTVEPSDSITGNVTLKLSAIQNTSNTSRSAVVTIKGVGFPPQTIYVSQNAKVPLIQVSTKALSIAKEVNSTSTVNVTSNTTWTASSNQSWLTISPNTSTTGNATITLTATENNTLTARTATVTISATGVTSQIITVTQNAQTPTLTVSSNTISIAKEANSTSSVNVTSNTTWTASSNQSWLTISPNTLTTGNATITLTATENNTITTRTATVTISATGVTSQIITVTQNAQTPTLTVSTNTINIAKEANSNSSILVTSNTTWTASSDKSWLTLSPNNATNGNASITFTATANPTIDSRSAIVTISATGVSPQIINITQTAGNQIVNLPITTLNIDTTQNNTTSIDITSNTTWIASSNQSWLTISPNTAITGNGTITITAESNQTKVNRTATISIITTSGTQTITVTQNAGNGTPVVEIKSDNILVYPNPASSNFSVNIEGQASVFVYSVLGDLVINTRIIDNTPISTSNLSKGLYVVKIQTKDACYTTNLIIE